MEFDEEFFKSGTLISVDSNRYLIGWGKRVWSKIPNLQEPSFYYPDFFLKTGKHWFNHENWKIVNRKDLSSHFSISNHEPLRWACSDKLTFTSAFYDLQRCFEEQALAKAVPYIFEHSGTKMSSSLLMFILRNVLEYSSNYPVYVYGMWTEEEGILGATPELLFEYESRVKTVACAGTYLAGKYELDKKTLQEHQLVIQGIQQSLEDLGKVQLGTMVFREFGSLGHLITPIEMIPTKPLNFLSLVNALHPTPALGAFPREKGWQWLEKYNTKISRGRFGAPVGFLHEKKASCVVAIRNVQWNRDGLSIGVGCGVVAESNLNEEWNELQLKLKAIKGIFAI